MAGTKEIKQRIRSVKNTKKITKAMELVAASKMKRAVSAATASRLYANYSWELLTSLSSRLEEVNHPFFNKNTATKDLLILISSNGGLCGAYNSQIIKKSISLLKRKNKENLDIITVGKKGDSAIRRLGHTIIASFIEIPDNSSVADISPLTFLILEEYKKNVYQNVFVAYTDFVSALNQKPKIRQLLPIIKEELKELIETIGEDNKNKEFKKEEKELNLSNKNETPYLIEGNTDKLIELLAEKLTRMQIYHMILESSASEQSARMMAMKNASEAAGDMIGNLTLVFNKARQAGITQEISEISAGMASID